ncbi:MAG: hypothetical protein KDA61_22255, partial [Planctomycetales bacterium]|nr:hypothetical protein [Planctomycetales bacterium]
MNNAQCSKAVFAGTLLSLAAVVVSATALVTADGRLGRHRDQSRLLGDAQRDVEAVLYATTATIQTNPHNFDLLTAAASELQQKLNVLGAPSSSSLNADALLDADALTSAARVDATLADASFRSLGRDFVREAAALLAEIEPLKSHAAIWRNSARYIPELIDHLASDERRASASRADAARHVLLALKSFEMRGSVALAERTSAQIDRYCQLFADDEHAADEVASLRRHAAAAISARQRIDEGLAQISQLPVLSNLAQLRTAHRAAGATLEGEVHEQRRWLTALAGALAAFALVSLWQLNRAARRLNDMNDSLVECVDERTGELLHRTAELERQTTELQVLRDAAVQATEAKSRFLANMSHE